MIKETKTTKIIKAERHEKKSLLECNKCKRNLYPENVWYLVWTDESYAISQARCRDCLMEEF